ncbi:hypothetical protein CR513_12023, partial [Mucuna pruriens]
MGVAKRKNCHLLEVVTTILFQIFVPNVNWGEVALIIKSHKQPSTSGLSYLEVEFIIKSEPFPTLDVQVQEVTLEELITEKAHNEAREEYRYYEEQYQKHEKPILVQQQVQLSKLEISILENLIGEVTDDIILFLNLCVLTISFSLQHQIIEAIKTPTLIQEALKDEN